MTSLLAAPPLSAAPSPDVAARGPQHVRCVEVDDAKAERVGPHWLLLGVERLGRTPPDDFRVATLRLDLLDERTATRRQLEVPLARLRASFAPVLAGGPESKNAKGTLLDNYQVDVVSVSADFSTVGLEIRGPAEGGGKQTSIAFWRVGSDEVRIAKAVQVTKRKERASHGAVGHDADGRLLLLDTRRLDAGSGRHTLTMELSRVDPRSAKQETIWRFTTPARRNDHISAGSRTALSRDRTRLAIPEYLESPGGEAEVHIINLRTGEHRAVPAMPTTYGVAFSPKGDHVALASNRLGQVELRAIAVGRLVASSKGFERLHKLLYGGSGAWIYAVGKAGTVTPLRADTLQPSPAAAWSPTRWLGRGALYGEVPASSDADNQPFGRVANKHGFGRLDRLCVVSLP